MFYWSQRIGLGLMLLFFVSVLTFGAMNILGDPLFNIVGPIAAQYDSLEQAAADGTITPPDQEILDKLRSARAEYNLDKSLPERYAIWAADFVTGDFGVQFSEDGEPPVSNLIKERLPRTLTLLVMAQLFAAIIAIPWAVLSASKANSFFDRSSTIASFAMLAMPSFALGIVLKYLFSIKLDIFPQTYTAGGFVAGTPLAAHAARAHPRHPGRRGLSAAAAHRSHHHAPGRLHPHGPLQGSPASAGCCSAMRYGRRCSRSSRCSASTPAP